MASSTHLSVGIRGSAEPFDKLVLCHCKWTRVFGFSLRPVLCKGVAPVDVPTKLNAAVVDSSVSPVADYSVSHVPEIRKVRWKRQRNVLGVLGVHVDDLVGGGNLAFQKAVQWLRTELEFGTWEQSRFRFRGRELSQEYNRKSIKISMSEFVQEMEPVAVPKHVKDDLDAPLETSVHSQFRGGVGQLQ